MKQIRLLAAALALAATTLPAAAQQLSLGALSNYLNSLTTAQAEFTQINADGTISTGTIFIKRPGRARFEYNPPEQTLVLASAGQLAIFDAKSNTGPEQYPLERTPLNLILARNVDLTRNNMVVGQSYDGTATTVTAQDPENPQYGNIQLTFTANPTELRQWVITDDAGQQTTVILGELRRGGSISDRNFSIVAEVDSRNR
ncbi:outer membrane lipoprotein carrier protein LolA [Maritimibacter sp. UBA3975]|uniref:LolA family protein n=1 Tax=Maritimibacter sp. UBA3975 TaxID=1946833 RepID=UPI000C0A55F9|nr:outer membrane lipoprotein carrier protein LolA [Maritimibacter sp. UBA3975]MAM62492.1 cell envelope biogenesis protein LolA [Maritimibacter sp.]|tara:strand:+ start:2579 stop:3181 length:603 start_codon:yes stop_codon:yes gene_type:complete